MKMPLRCIAVACVALLVGCDDAPPPRKMQTVKLLPDQLPPPPPPKPEEKKPEPPKPEKQAQAQQPKPAEAPPQNELRSDEAAGTGPGNGLVAGAVTQDYAGQRAASAPQIGGGGDGGAAQRLAANQFASSATRALNEFLQRDRELRRADYRAQVHLWLAPSGALQRVELVSGTGDAELDRTLREALTRFPGAGSAPPQALEQPIRLQVTNRMLG
jgi:periplasmic protein TonB